MAIFNSYVKLPEGSWDHPTDVCDSREKISTVKQEAKSEQKHWPYNAESRPLTLPGMLQNHPT